MSMRSRALRSTSCTAWLIVLGIFVATTSGCSEKSTLSKHTNQTLQGDLEHNGIQFETSTSHSIPFTLPRGSKLALLHDDRDETERLVRVALEQAVFSLKQSISNLIVVDRRSVEDIKKELKFQASGLVRDQELAQVGHFLGLDYVVVFETIFPDLDELYGLRNQIGTWEVALPLKVIAVNSAEVKLHCLATVKAKAGKQMAASEVRLMNQEAIGIATSLTTQCLTKSLADTAQHP